MIAALGGSANLTAIDACTTRLRLTVANQDAVDEPALRRLGARGLIRPSVNTLQVVLGPIADQVAGELRAFVRGGDTSVDQAFAVCLLQALGGRANVVDVAAASTRLLVTLRDDSSLDESALRSLDLRGIARPAPLRLHLLVGPQATALGGVLAAASRS